MERDGKSMVESGDYRPTPVVMLDRRRESNFDVTGRCVGDMLLLVTGWGGGADWPAAMAAWCFLHRSTSRWYMVLMWSYLFSRTLCQRTTTNSYLHVTHNTLFSHVLAVIHKSISVLCPSSLVVHILWHHRNRFIITHADGSHTSTAIVHICLWFCLCTLSVCSVPKTVSLLEYPKVIRCTKFQHFGIIRFWVMLQTNKQTDGLGNPTDANRQSDIVGVGNNSNYIINYNNCFTCSVPLQHVISVTLH